MTTTTTLRLSAEAYSAVVQSVSHDDHDFEEQCTASLTAKQFDQFAQLMMQRLNTVMESHKKDSRDVESFVLVVSSAILQGGRQQEQINQLTTLLSQTAVDESSQYVALKTLYSLLNIISPKSMSQLHFSVLQSLVNVAAKTQVGKRFLHAHCNAHNVDALVARWGHGHKAMELLANSTQDIELYDKYINSFNEKNADQADEDTIAHGVVEAIRDADYFRFDALRSAPVIEMRLKKSTKHSALVDLLDIFVSGTYSDYLKFASGANGALIANSGLNADDNARKMRLLTLVTIFCNSKGNTTSTTVVPYGTIASELQIDIGEVERYVVDAVNSGLCQVKMNQLTQTVSVITTVHREFTAQQWETIHSQLDLWKTSIGGLLNTLEQNKVKQRNHQQQQQQSQQRINRPSSRK